MEKTDVSVVFNIPVEADDAEVIKNKEEIIRLNQQIKAEKLAVKEAQERQKELQTKVTKLRSEMTDRERRLNDKEAYVLDLEKQKRILIEEINNLKGKRKIKVQLLCKEDDENMADVVDKLSCAINKHQKGPEIAVIRCMKASEIQKDIPVVLFCFAHNGIVQTILNALKGMTASTNMSVVIVHNRGGEPLQPSFSHEDVVKNKTCKALGGIFDIALTCEKGLYDCEMNKAAVDNIVKFVVLNA